MRWPVLPCLLLWNLSALAGEAPPPEVAIELKLLPEAANPIPVEALVKTRWESGYRTVNGLSTNFLCEFKTEPADTSQLRLVQSRAIYRSGKAALAEKNRNQKSSWNGRENCRAKARSSG